MTVLVPAPTLIYRFFHIDNLTVYLNREVLHAPNFEPDDGLKYKPIHNVNIQSSRHNKTVPCGNQGTLHDYVPFYFGPLSPMLLQLHTDQVEGYDEGQEPLVYVVSSVQEIQRSNLSYVFTDGHGIASFTSWYDDMTDLDKVDWNVVAARYWRDTMDDMDRQRRKQSEFLIHSFCPWECVDYIAVCNQTIKLEVENILNDFNLSNTRTIVKSQWYF